MFGLFSFLLVLESTNAAVNTIHPFSNYMPIIPNRRFIGKIVERKPVTSQLHCASLCSRDEHCKSANYNKKFRNCSLSNEEAAFNSDALVQSEDNFYLQVVCIYI